MIVQFICRAILLAVPMLYGTTGEIVTEKSGHLNLGIPGIMYVGAISGVVGSFLYENACGNDIANMNGFLAVIIPLLCSIAGSVIMGLIYSFLTVTLHANQNVTGLALTTFGVGVYHFWGRSLTKDFPSLDNAPAFKAMVADNGIPGLCDIPYIGKLLFSYNSFVYLAVIIAVVCWIYIRKSRPGLKLRAVGENPATADSAGINVNRYKYLATCLGCMVAGLGGLYYVMDYASGIWANNAFGDRGWLAIALVIFTVWRPNVGVLASYLFGGLYILHMYIPSGMNLAVKELYKMLPYVVTIIVLIISSLRNQRDKQPPESLGLPYFREDR